MPEIGVLVEKVLLRLSLPRVGFLWMEEGLDFHFPDVRAFYPVHFRIDRPMAARPNEKILQGITAPENEAAFLDLLVVLPATDSLLSELVSGFPKRPCARLVAGCLDRGVRVLSFLDGSSAGFSCYGRYGSYRNKTLTLLDRLGFSVIPLDKSDAEDTGESAGTCVLDKAGWYSWADVAHLPGKCKRLQLGRQSRLTVEARERLDRLGVEMEVAPEWRER